jgi:hypothetical protein
MRAIVFVLAHICIMNLVCHGSVPLLRNDIFHVKISDIILILLAESRAELSQLKFSFYRCYSEHALGSKSTIRYLIFVEKYLWLGHYRAA